MICLQENVCFLHDIQLQGLCVSPPANMCVCVCGKDDVSVPCHLCFTDCVELTVLSITQKFAHFLPRFLSLASI